MFVRAFECPIETACEHVLFDLAVPLVRHELFEPLGKALKFRGREAGNESFKFLNAHTFTLRCVLDSEK
jgi:hypothetical protein